MRRRSTVGRAFTAAVGLVASVVLVSALAACGSGGTTAVATSFAPPPTSGLAAKLPTPPRYSQPGQTAWSRDYTPDTDAFLKQFYAPTVRSKIAATLKQQKLRDIAHVFWVVDRSTASDLVLLQFADAAGAQARLRFVTAPVKRNYNLKTFQADVPGHPTVYYTPAADQQGYLQAKTYVAVGNIVVEMFLTATTDDLPRDQLAQWLGEQLQRLGR